MAETNCLFCKIADGEVSADVVREDDRILAFRDINPQAPTHILLIPRKHIPSVDELDPEDADLVGELFLAAKELAREEELGGYRLVMNTGRRAGQSVFHIHLHLLGGRSMGWPPG